MGDPRPMRMLATGRMHATPRAGTRAARACPMRMHAARMHAKSQAAARSMRAACMQTGSTNSNSNLRYLNWDDYFMSVAFLSSQRSKDPNKQVGRGDGAPSC